MARAGKPRRPRRLRWSRGLLALGALSAVLTPRLSASVASAATSTPACAATSLSAIAFSDEARYAPGTPVRLSVIVRNDDAASCALSVGPQTPGVIVSDAAGASVFQPCGLGNPCPQWLRLVSLAPGAWYRASFTWNQRVGANAAPPGRYRVRTGSPAGPGGSFTISLGTRTSGPTRVLSLTSSTQSLALGARLVLLGAPGSLYSYSAPASPGAVLAREISRGGPGVMAVFTARRVGQTSVITTGTPRCYPACLLPSRLYRLRVVVR